MSAQGSIMPTLMAKKYVKREQRGEKFKDFTPKVKMLQTDNWSKSFIAQNNGDRLAKSNKKVLKKKEKTE